MFFAINIDDHMVWTKEQSTMYSVIIILLRYKRRIFPSMTSFHFRFVLPGKLMNGQLCWDFLVEGICGIYTGELSLLCTFTEWLLPLKHFIITLVKFSLQQATVYYNWCNSKIHGMMFICFIMWPGKSLNYFCEIISIKQITPAFISVFGNS